MTKNSPEVNRRHGRAQSRARQALVERHRKEFLELLDHEKAKEGIPTLRARKIPMGQA